MTEEPKCTCPCIDCIEGNHCGGEYWWPEDAGEDGPEPELIGVCEYISDEQWHEMGLIVEGCNCHRCNPNDYDDDYPEDE